MIMSEYNIKLVLKIVIIVLLSDVFTINGYHLYDSQNAFYQEIDSDTGWLTSVSDTQQNFTDTTDEEIPEGEVMDFITIVWYFSTFLALIIFFIYMACSDNCHRLPKPVEVTRPVTPAPDYKNFAPPSYDSAIKKMKSNRVFIVPIHGENNFFNNITGVEGATVNNNNSVVIDNRSESEARNADINSLPL